MRGMRPNKIDLPDKIGIDNTDRTSGGSLGREMVDIRYLYAIQKETVFRGTSSSYHQVVTKRCRGRYSGKGLYYPGDIPVSSRFSLSP